MPILQGIHHLKFPISDLDRSLTFYEGILDARRVGAWDHVRADGSLYAVILEVPGLGTYLELRLSPDHAERQAGFDPVTFLVRDRSDLECWIGHLDAAGIEHSPILVSIQAWLVVFADPDGRRLRLYTHEMHSQNLAPDEDSLWISGN